MSDPAAGHHPDLLTISEAADLLRAPVATLRYWRLLGTGPRSFRLGRRVLYRRDDLYRWIDARHDQGSPGASPAAEAQPDIGAQRRNLAPVSTARGLHGSRPATPRPPVTSDETER